jgi:hypothetical protein
MNPYREQSSKSLQMCRLASSKSRDHLISLMPNKESSSKYSVIIKNGRKKNLLKTKLNIIIIWKMGEENLFKTKLDIIITWRYMSVTMN